MSGTRREGKRCRREGREGKAGEGAIVPRGFLEGIVLAHLYKREGLHGYGIMKVVEESTGFWKPSPGTVYPLLQKLEREGLVEKVEDAKRKVYMLTEKGREQARRFLRKKTVLKREIIRELGRLMGLSPEGIKRVLEEDSEGEKIEEEFHRLAALAIRAKATRGIEGARMVARILEDARKKLERVVDSNGQDRG